MGFAYCFHCDCNDSVSPGLPVWVGKKIYTRYEFSNKHKRNLAIFGGVAATVSIHKYCDK